MELVFAFGADSEAKRVEQTLRKLGWYRNKGYSPFLPEGIDENSSLDQIREAVENAFDARGYEAFARKAEMDFGRISGDFEVFLKDTFGEVPESFRVRLTRYGTGGSYNPPNMITCNIDTSRGYLTIAHEIVHIMIEPYVQKYAIGHWEKERTVDLILNSGRCGFADSGRRIKKYKGADRHVDPLFEKLFFQDMEGYFKAIGQAGS